MGYDIMDLKGTGSKKNESGRIKLIQILELMPQNIPKIRKMTGKSAENRQPKTMRQ